ncbi:Thiol-disulfide isomerase or thioredoxin [Alteribacillus bidgolensis]|uniref:Thiol-disulfide isomerase or thioredoxin n=1 Tax=Alteribacillus bidgolensis TaxID=930129 RepID=A0A1G8ERX9_9BACI|nr:Thiol-disulfide isomerase or thioredoxin [Alteribacillus bidgolensis]
MLENIEERTEFEDVISQDRTVVMFSADWCPDCRVIEPVLPEIEKENNDFAFYHADRDRLIDVCQEYDVFGIPSFIAFHRGIEIHRFVSKTKKTPDEVQQFLNETKIHLDQ